MPLKRSGFEIQFEEILSGVPQLGKAAVIPWDTEIFGFPVASYHAEVEVALDRALRETLVTHFPAWMMSHRVSVCSCVIPAGNLFWKSFLPDLGFRFVDFAIEARCRDLSTAVLPEARISLRHPSPEDHPMIEALAERSFAHGRYFADGLFSRERAQRRYQRWMANALGASTSSDLVFVLGEPGSVEGFFHVAVNGSTADLRLAAITPELQRTGIGWDLYVAVLHTLRDAGVRRVVTIISTANTVVLNLYSSLGFRFAQPEATYHWHAPLN